MNKKFLLLIFLLLTQSAHAFTWRDLWWRPDQQAQQLMAKGQFKKAADEFENPEWAAVAEYRAGEYQKAVKALENQSSVRAKYNRGNALAHLGDYKAAIAAYDKALALNPNHEDAKFNKALLEKLMQQKSSSQKQSSNQSKQNKNQNQQQEKQKNQQPSSADNQQKQQNKKQQSNKRNQAQKENAKPQNQKQAEKEAAKKWLSQIPDAPNGLLRQKFLRDYLKQQQ